MPDCFISYRRTPSSAVATTIQSKLESQHQIDAYLDVTRADGAHVQFPDRLMKAIEDAPVFICVLGESDGQHTLESEWVLKEIQRAYELKKPCVPVFQESYDPIETTSEAVNYLLAFDAVHYFDRKNVMIDASIKDLADRIKPNTSPVSTLRSPTLDLNLRLATVLKFDLDNVTYNREGKLAPNQSSLIRQNPQERYTVPVGIRAGIIYCIPALIIGNVIAIILSNLYFSAVLNLFVGFVILFIGSFFFMFLLNELVPNLTYEYEKSSVNEMGCGIIVFLQFLIIPIYVIYLFTTGITIGTVILIILSLNIHILLTGLFSGFLGHWIKYRDVPPTIPPIHKVDGTLLPSEHDSQYYLSVGTVTFVTDKASYDRINNSEMLQSVGIRVYYYLKYGEYERRYDGEIFRAYVQPQNVILSAEQL